MSERTPQDVLRELAGLQQEALHFEHPPSDEVIAPYRNVAAMRLMAALTDIDFAALAAALDKAIAEAPDSPPEPDCLCGAPAHDPGCAAHGGYRPDHERAAPDTLSEKPGVDVERLAQAIQSTILTSPDQYLDPGMGAYRTRWADLTPTQRCHVVTDAEALAAEYDRLGSTDSEGQ